MNLNKFLKENRRKIFHKIANTLHDKSSEKYCERPFEELLTTASEATDGFHAVLAGDDFSPMDSFIEKIAPMRLNAGFLMSDVQKAFDLYRIVLVPILMNSIQPNELRQVLSKLNLCLTETITKFSDYFQFLHEREVRQYARRLEEEVKSRTEELSESEAKYRVLVEDINDGYFVNQNGIITFVNKAFCDMHGCTMDELIGRPYFNLAAPGSLPGVQAFYERRLNQEDAPEQYTYYRLHKDGSSLPTEIKVKPIMYKDECATAGICRDITERVKMEQRIREAESLAHIGQLTTSLAHEIRNPLSSIKIGIQMMLKRANLDDAGRRTVEISSREIARLEKILEQMLDSAKPLILSLEMISINAIIGSCLEILEGRIKEKAIRISRKLSPRIMHALLDKEKMEQVIINILLNSVEMLPYGGRITIITKLEEDTGSFMTVKISDNGPGVLDEYLPYIFDPFFSKKKKGTGLGLATVKKIVEAHGGQVKAISGRKGLLLTFSLPVKK